MKIEIKNLKFYPAMSEETNAFICDLFIDGKKAAYCKNDGHGGSTNYTPYTNQRSLIEQAESYAKNQPDIIVDLGYKAISLNSTLEMIIDTAIEEQLLAKEKKRFDNKMQKDFLKFICIITFIWTTI